MKHCIIVYLDSSDKSEASGKALQEILAGIEEEGVRFEVGAAYCKDACGLARAAARESSFGCGIGISKSHAELWLLSHGMSILSSDNQETMRRLGLNAGRALKKLPFV